MDKYPLTQAKQEHQHKEDTLKKEATRLTTALTAAQEEVGVLVLVCRCVVACV